MNIRLIVITLLMINLFSSCILSDHDKVEHTFSKYQKSLEKNDGESIFNMLDEKSHDYLKSVHSKIKNLDSVGVSHLNYAEGYMVLSARALIIRDSIMDTDYKSLFVKLFSSKKFDNLNDKIKNYEYDRVQINGDEATLIMPRFDLSHVNLSKSNSEWKINLKSIDKLKDQIFEKTFNPGTQNSMPIFEFRVKHMQIGLSNILGYKYPLDLLYWPFHTRQELLKSRYVFSKSADCNRNQSWGFLDNKRILFFLTQDDFGADFYKKFSNDKNFVNFCSENINVIALTHNCHISTDLYNKFEINSFPTILILNQNDEILRKMVGVLWEPDSVLENIKQTNANNL